MIRSWHASNRFWLTLLFWARSRQNAVVGLLRNAERPGVSQVNLQATAYELLSAYIAGPNKAKALELLRDLEQRLGKPAVLDRLQNEIMDQLPMTCPSCSKQLTCKDMARHLWDKHRLVLDGLRAREPWRVLEDWVVDYRVEKDPALLRRCTDLARDADGNKGVLRLQQLMLQHGVDDAEARTAVLGQAQEQQATVCPKCFHLVPAIRNGHVAVLGSVIYAKDDFETVIHDGIDTTVEAQGATGFFMIPLAWKKMRMSWRCTAW